MITYKLAHPKLRSYTILICIYSTDPWITPKIPSSTLPTYNLLNKIYRNYLFLVFIQIIIIIIIEFFIVSNILVINMDSNTT